MAMQNSQKHHQHTQPILIYILFHWLWSEAGKRPQIQTERIPWVHSAREVGRGSGLTCWTSLSPFDIFSVYTKELNILCKKNQKGCVREAFFVINVTGKQLQKVDGWGNGVREGHGESPSARVPNGGICMERLTLEAKIEQVFFSQTFVYLPNWHKVQKK